MTQRQSKQSGLALCFIVFSVILTAILLLFWWTMYRFSHDAETDIAIDAQNSLTVILDAGHGGEDGGAVSAGGVREKDLNLMIVKEMEAYLSGKGYRVICTRTEDVLLYDRNVDYKGRKKVLDLAARLKISRETDNSIFVSIHMNSFPQTQYRGLQVYYSPNHADSAELASLIQNEVRTRLQPENSRATKAASSNIYLLDRITTPAVLVECGFLSNAEECRLLCDEAYRKELSLILSDAIMEFINQQVTKTS